MSLRWLVCKHMPDQRRRETENVGVILFEGDRAVAARFRGERVDGDLDGRQIHWASDARIYRSWVRYWRSLMAKGALEGEYLLDRGYDSFFVEQGGEAAHEDHPHVETLMELYQILVAPVPAVESEDRGFSHQVKSLLNASGLPSLPEFKRSYTAEVEAEDGTLMSFNFPIALVNGSIKAVAKQTATLTQTWALGAVSEFQFLRAPINVIITREPHLAEDVTQYIERHDTRIVDVEVDTPQDLRDKFLSTTA